MSAPTTPTAADPVSPPTAVGSVVRADTPPATSSVSGQVAGDPPAQEREESAGRTRGGLLILIGLLLVAVNLRTAITSLGALLEEVRDGLQLSGAVAGLVTTMPAVAFAVFGALTPALVRRTS